MADYDSIAEHYDLTHSTRILRDKKFYINEAKKARGKVLEVACGTGRIYLPLLEAGVDAYGIDISSKMLAVLEKKAKSEGLSPKVWLSDMRTFKHKEKFSLILIPFRAFLHMLTTRDQLSTLKNLRAHLSPGGKLILNFFFPSPAFIASKYGKGKRNKEFLDRKTGIAVTSESYFIDEPNQIVQCIFRISRHGRQIAIQKFRLALIYKKEFEFLLRLAGFSKWHVYGGFKKEKLKSSKQEMVWVIEK